MSISQTINQMHATVKTSAVMVHNIESYTPTEQYLVSEFTTYMTKEIIMKLNDKVMLLGAVAVLL